ncbi:VWA domain-containing protein [bacterium]|nr:VWA domain-containing protein [bacterium]
MKKWILLPLILLATVDQGSADGLIVIHDPPRRPGRVAPRHYAFAPLEVVYHHVQVKITGQVARTEVDQEFFNPNDQRLEGTYLFPVPKGAQIDKFTMEIDGRQVEAELLPAEKARQIYEDIVRKLRDPALLEYAGQDTFKVRIFPIEPLRGKRVTLAYTQVLSADNGLVGYLYPLNTEKFSAAPIKTVSVRIDLDAQRPLKAVYSPSHSIEINRHGDQRATIGFEGKDLRPDTDFSVFWTCEDKDIGVSLLTYRERGEDGYFLLLASPGADERARGRVIPKDVAFVLDTSGSMVGAKLAQAKNALRFCVENLNDHDRFELIRFSTEAEPLFDGLVDATAANRRRATEFIDDLKPIGGTAIEEALLEALALRPRRNDRPYVVIFLTDGQPTIGTTKESEILDALQKADPHQTRIFCFGIGTDVNTHLLDRITEMTRAVSQYVLPEEDLELKVSSFYTKINEPVLADPELEFTGAIRISKLYPNPLPDLFHGDQVVVVGRYQGHGPAAAIIAGTVSGDRIGLTSRSKRYAYDVQFPEQARAHEFIPRLWATRRVGYLLDEIRLHGENKELRDEVTELARRYGIVTPYTAYLIVEDESRRRVPAAARTLQDFERDRPVREQAGAAWDVFHSTTSGNGAVTGARASGSLKGASDLSAFGTAGKARQENARAFVAATPAPASGEVARRFDQYAQQTRFVNGQAFYQNGDQWIDARVQHLPRARRVQVKFNSAAYFALLAKHPHAAPWLSVGRTLQVALNDIVYEISE